MSLFTIGRVEENGKTVAYRIYDDETKQSKIYPRGHVSDTLIKGVRITGLKVKSVFGTKLEKDYYAMMNEHHLFITNDLTLLNGAGEAIGVAKYVLLGIVGFCEQKRYKLVNCMGEESLVEQDTFEMMLKDNLIIGAAYQNGKIQIHKNCGKRFVE